MSMDMCWSKIALKLEFFSGIWQYGNRDFQHSDTGLKCLYFVLGLSSASKAQKTHVPLISY